MDPLNPVKIKVLVYIEFVVKYDEVTLDQSNKPFVGNLADYIFFVAIQNNVAQDAELIAPILTCCRQRDNPRGAGPHTWVLIGNCHRKQPPSMCTIVPLEKDKRSSFFTHCRT